MKMLGDRVLIEVCDTETKTASGIIIPDTHTERPAQGKVIAVGNGRLTENGKLLPMSVNVGDIVVFGKYAGNEIKHKGRDLLIIKEDDIFCCITE